MRVGLKYGLLNIWRLGINQLNLQIGLLMLAKDHFLVNAHFVEDVFPSIVTSA